MSAINLRSVMVGGIVAGLVAIAFDFLITSYLMAAEFSAMLARLNLSEGAMQRWIWVFGIADFAWGFLLVFTYAAIRPRFGPGPQTAIIGAVILWLALAIGVLILMAIGLHTPRSYAMSTALYLVSALAASIAGASLYKEP